MLFKPLSEQCEAECRQMDCVQESFEVTHVDTTCISNSLTEVRMMLNDGVEVRVKYGPAFTVAQLISNIQSNYGFWIGGSLLELIRCALNAAIAFYKRRRSQV